jgi:predicted phage baseplate assembly protein
MRIPDIQLDDRSFQTLVTEARTRVAKACPEWTDHNVSDPGITLIELFAWMTDMLVYRLNRVPDKLHVRLLELLDIRLEPPVAADVDVRFRLAAPAVEPVRIPAIRTEVATERTIDTEAVVFQVEEDFTIPAAQPIGYVLARGKDRIDVGTSRGWARPTGNDQLPFGAPPAPGDALHLGFREPLGRLMLQVYVDCARARGPGVDPDDPPLVWEVSSGPDAADPAALLRDDDGLWAPAEVLHDSTGGFNRGSGVVELQLPAVTATTELAGQEAHWLRCRVTERRRSGAAGPGYQQAPEIYGITVGPVGALVPASHAVSEGEETLGTSDGTPGQCFEIRHVPVLALRRHERLQVRDPVTGVWEDWEWRESFAESRERDRHYVLDVASGTLELGPAIRTVSGSWEQHGAIPPTGATLRITGYRHGGGQAGNVAADALRVLRTAIPGVAHVTNPRHALGGVDAETLDNARERAAMEFRARYRAVTAADYEFLAGEASPQVARARCVAAEKPGDAVRVHILPRVEPADRHMSEDQLRPEAGLVEVVRRFLDGRRPVGASIDVLPVELRGITVVVNVQAAPRANVERIEQDLLYALNVYLNPLIGGSQHGPGSGWEFGRALNTGELYGLAHAVPGVEFVQFLRMYETDVATWVPEAREAGSHVLLKPAEVVVSGRHQVQVEQRQL